MPQKKDDEYAELWKQVKAVRDRCWLFRCTGGSYRLPRLPPAPCLPCGLCLLQLPAEGFEQPSSHLTPTFPPTHLPPHSLLPPRLQVEAEFQRELAEKDATLAAIEAAAAEAAAGAELERRELQQQVASQEAAAQAEVAAAQQEAEAARSQAATAQAAAQQAQQATLREAEEKHRHLAARVGGMQAAACGFHCMLCGTGLHKDPPATLFQGLP